MEQKMDVNGKTVEIRIKSGVLVIVTYEFSFLGFDVLWLWKMLREGTEYRAHGNALCYLCIPKFKKIYLIMSRSKSHGVLQEYRDKKILLRGKYLVVKDQFKSLVSVK